MKRNVLLTTVIALLLVTLCSVGIFAKVIDAELDLGELFGDEESNADYDIFASGGNLDYCYDDYELTRENISSVIVDIFEIEAEIENEECPFDDISDDSEYYNDIMILYKLGMINGVSETKFSPESNVTRAQVAVLVTRALITQYGIEPEPATENTWYSSCVNTVLKHGIMTTVEDEDWHENATRYDIRDFYIYKLVGAFETITFDESSGTITFENEFLDTEEEKSVYLPKCLTPMREQIIHIIIEDGFERIDDSAFSRCVNLESVDIPQTVTTVGNYAFYKCSNMTDVNNMKEIESIGNYAFYGCSGMSSVKKLEKIISIGNYAFYNCSRIENISFGDSLTSIGNNAFRSCNKISNVTIPGSVIDLGSYAFFNCSNLSELTIEDGVKNIGNAAFSLCSELTSINVPNSVTKINNNVFYKCKKLSYVKIGSGVSDIEISAFSGCDSLTNIEVDENNESYLNDENGVLYNKNKDEILLYPRAKKSTDFTIPDGVISIGENAFFDCVYLKNVEIPKSVIKIGVRAFEGCANLFKAEIPAGVVNIGKYAFLECSQLTKITVDEENNFYSSDKNGVLYDRLSNTLLLYPCGNKSVSFEVPADVTTIGEEAFSCCNNLVKVNVGNGVSVISDYAFFGCEKLAEIVMGNNVKSIGNKAFSSCISLLNVTIADGLETITKHSFSKCKALKTITIPKSVTSIRSGAFDGCEKLSIVYYGGTLEEWKDITIEQGNDALKQAALYAEAEPDDTVKGDINGDGKFDYYDVAKLYAIYRGKATFDE